MVHGTITVDAVRAQLVKLGRHDVSDARIEEFLQQRPTRRAAREDDDNESVATTTTTTTTTTAAAITTSDEEYEIEHVHMNDSRHRHDGTRNKMTRRRPPWNGDAFELLSLRATTAQTRVYPRRKAHEGDEIGSKVDVVKLGAEYRKVWSRSPLLSGTARPKVGFAEKFAALHEAERLKSLERKRRQDI